MGTNTIDCKVVMLSIKEQGYTNKISLMIPDSRQDKGYSNQHLYFTSDDSTLQSTTDIRKVYDSETKYILEPEFGNLTGIEGRYFKVEASTDPSLGLPTIPQQWIKDVYIPSNGSITDVRLEVYSDDRAGHYEKALDYKFGQEYRNSLLKITGNNEVVIAKELSDCEIQAIMDEPSLGMFEESLIETMMQDHIEGKEEKKMQITVADVKSKSTAITSTECLAGEDYPAYSKLIAEAKEEGGEFKQIADHGDCFIDENRTHYLICDCGITSLYKKNSIDVESNKKIIQDQILAITKNFGIVEKKKVSTPEEMVRGLTESNTDAKGFVHPEVVVEMIKAYHQRMTAQKALSSEEIRQLALKEYPIDLHETSHGVYDDLNERERSIWIAGYIANGKQSTGGWSDSSKTGFGILTEFNKLFRTEKKENTEVVMLDLNLKTDELARMMGMTKDDVMNYICNAFMIPKSYFDVG